MSFSSNITKVNYSCNLNISNNKKYNTNFDKYDIKDNIFNAKIDDEEMNHFKYELNEIHYPEIDNDNYTAQGITIIDGKTFISAHGEKNARLYIYDNKTMKYIGYINLDQSSHVGGTTFDSENNVLYVTNGGGNYSTYDYITIKNAIESTDYREDGIFKYTLNPVKKIEINDFENLLIVSEDEELLSFIDKYGIEYVYTNWINNTQGDIYDKITHAIRANHKEIIQNNIEARCTASTTCYHNGLLYTCHFVGTKNGEMDILKPIYNTNKYGDITITYEKVNDELIKIPPRVQGIAITEHKGKQYILFSQSIGKHNDSSITVYEVTEDGKYINRGIKYFQEDGMEGITVDENGIITACFEFEDYTLKTDMDNLLNDLSSQHDYDNWIPHFLQKLGGIYWDTGAETTWEHVKSAWSDLENEVSIKNVTKAAFSYLGSGSEVIKFAIYIVVPETLRNNGFVYNTMDFVDYGLDTFGKDIAFNYSDEIKEHGTLSGITRGTLINLTTTGAKISNLGFKGILTLGEGTATLINKGSKAIGLDFKIDLDSFKEARESVSTRINNLIDDTTEVVEFGVDKLEEKVTEFGKDVIEIKDYVVDNGKDILSDVGDGLEYAWDNTGGKVVKGISKHLPFL